MKEHYSDFLTEEMESELIRGMVVGKLLAISKAGCPLIDFQRNASNLPLAARTIVAVDKQDIGREMTLMFENGDPEKPVITGIIQPMTPENGLANNKNMTAKVDDERVVLDAKKEIVLRCGKASITLTRAGKILIRGKYLLSRSSGANRIKGGSVQIN